MTTVHLVTAGGPADGGGHLSRSVAMAEALAGTGATVSFEILRGAPTESQADRLRELGVGMGAADPNAVILVDLPNPNQILGRWPAERLALFDDREWFGGSAALIIQPSLTSWSGSADARRVLEGYDYVPIRTSLRRYSDEPLPEATPAEVVVSFGGSDPEDVGARVVPAIAAGRSWSTVAIVGPSYRGDLVETWTGGASKRLNVLRDPRDLETRLAAATLVVSGAGTMKFELALLGRPMILLAVGDDQLPVGPPFAGTGAAEYLGDGRTIDPATVVAAVTRLMADQQARASMAARGRAVVDGRGAERVAAAVLELTSRRRGAPHPTDASTG
jgi:spore coat polysaccharide biosynthesis predicted glycosyltransferase SpsG